MAVMGVRREYNPLMESSWTPVPIKEQFFYVESVYPNGTTRRAIDWASVKALVHSASEWCEGEMIHGRFSVGLWGSFPKFYFKNKKDAILFKLAWG